MIKRKIVPRILGTNIWSHLWIHFWPSFKNEEDSLFIEDTWHSLANILESNIEYKLEKRLEEQEL